MSHSLQEGLDEAEIAGAERHLFLCIGPDCCSFSEGERVWKHVKKSLRKSGMKAMRTKASCFRICTGGPWLLIYPDGVWYGEMTEERFDRILKEHLIGRKPVTEWIVTRNKLCSA